MPVCLMVVFAVASVDYSFSLFLYDTYFYHYSHPTVISTHAVLAVATSIIESLTVTLLRGFVFYIM